MNTNPLKIADADTSRAHDSRQPSSAKLATLALSDTHARLVASVALARDLRPYTLYSVDCGERYHENLTNYTHKYVWGANTLERAKLGLGRVSDRAVIFGPRNERWAYVDGDWQQWTEN